MRQLVNTGVRNPEIRAVLMMCVDGIKGATQALWHHQSLESVDHRRLMREALEFYADGGNDGGERARAVFAIFEADRAEYWRPFPAALDAEPR
jgi:hypothetical protein